MAARFTSLASAVWGLLVFAMVIMLWAADIQSCVRKTPAAEGPTPRPPRHDAAAEVRLVTCLTSLWIASGRSADTLDVWMVDDDAINAGSFGDGTFALWTGLHRVPDEELAAIFAHELAHDRLLHARKSAELRDVTDLLGNAIGIFAHRDEATTQTLRRWSGNLIMPKYDRAQELEADEEAVDVLAMAGYSEPAATLCGAFAHLRSVVGEAGGGFFDSHPALTERIQALRTRRPSAAAETACR
jgi:predicted Zn-dependent protease